MAQTHAEPQQTLLHVDGMTCGNCSLRVRNALQSVDGVDFATVELQTHSARVHWLPARSENGADASLVTALKNAGYAARIAPPSTTDRKAAGATPTVSDGESKHEHAPDHNSDNPWRSPLLLGIPVTVLLLLADWVLHLGMEPWFHWTAFLLATPVQIWLGGRFYKGAWEQLKVGRSNMDTLVSLGSSAAYGYSVVALFLGDAGHLYFAEAVTILTLISVGHWLESRMTLQAGNTLRSLMQLRPEIARKIGTDGIESMVPVHELLPGDRIRVMPGDRIPVDASIVDGSSTVEEAMLTGESMPQERNVGGRILAGTINLTGALIAIVEATGGTTALARIIQAVERAQGSRAAIQRLADRISSIFVPIVIVIAIASAITWGFAPDFARAVHNAVASVLWSTDVPTQPVAAAMVIAAAILIVACPCAMGIATPVALMAGVNAAARQGILVRDAIALEKSGNITTLIFDKTGTLTRGRPEVVATHRRDPANLHSESAASSNHTDTQADAIALALAERSQHPLSRAVVQWAQGATVSRRRSHPTAHDSASQPTAATTLIEGWKELRGLGIEAHQSEQSGCEPGCESANPDERDPEIQKTDAASTWRLGSLPWCRSLGIDVTDLSSFTDTHTLSGATILVLTHENRWKLAFAIRDAIDPAAPKVLANLRQQGLKVRLLTGDLKTTAQAIGNDLGFEPNEIDAEVRPEEKAGIIQSLQKGGEKVGFIGDGINDAPALAQADLGIAVTQATDVAREAADIVLLRSDIDAVPLALKLAASTLRVIRQNLFWAFFYNAAAVPLAAVGLLSPVVCAVTMGMSDVIVVGNSLRLRRHGRK